MPEAKPAAAPAAPRPDVDRLRATSLDKINKAIASISKSAVALNEAIHEAAVMCMEHAHGVGNGDCSSAARLVDALPMSHRRSLLIDWFGTFSPITIAKDSKSKGMKAHLKGTAEERVWNIEPAKATPFYAMPKVENEPDVPTYEDIHNNVLAFIKRTKAKAEKIENEDQKRKALAELTTLEKAMPQNEVEQLKARIAELEAANAPKANAA